MTQNHPCDHCAVRCDALTTDSALITCDNVITYAYGGKAIMH